MKTRRLSLTTSRRIQPKIRPGFSLIEILVTVLIIGILAGVAAPRYSDAKIYFEVRAAAQRLRSDLELARTSARAASVSTVVTFDVAANCYSLANVSHLDHPTSTYKVELAQTPYPASLVSVSLGTDGTARSITFDIYGRPDRGGSIVVQSGALQRTVLIDSVTGRVTLP